MTDEMPASWPERPVNAPTLRPGHDAQDSDMTAEILHRLTHSRHRHDAGHAPISGCETPKPAAPFSHTLSTSTPARGCPGGRRGPFSAQTPTVSGHADDCHD